MISDNSTYQYDDFLNLVNRTITTKEDMSKGVENKVREFLLQNKEQLIQHRSDDALYVALVGLSSRIYELHTTDEQFLLSSKINHIADSLKNNSEMTAEDYSEMVNELSSEPSQPFKTALKDVSISNMSPEKIKEFGTEEFVTIRTLTESNAIRTDVPKIFFGGTSYQRSFAGALEKQLLTDLAGLQSQDIYLDIGCGEGAAISEYRESYPQGAAVVGITVTPPSPDKIDEIIERDRTDEKFAYCLCDFNQFPASALKGQVSIATDVFGGFRYGRDPTRYIQQVGELLKPGGKIYIRYLLNDGIEIPKEKNFVNYGGRADSCDLLLLWFHTIKGFDVIQPGMTLEESLAYRKYCFEEASDLYKLGSKQKEDGSYRIVLQRNSDQVQVDKLVADPRYASPASEAKKDVESWYPYYRWEMSDDTKSLIQGKSMILFE